jgi:hypothetical protein
VHSDLATSFSSHLRLVLLFPSKRVVADKFVKHDPYLKKIHYVAVASLTKDMAL